MAKAFNMSDFHERYAYSGGNAWLFNRDLGDLKMRVQCQSVTADTPVAQPECHTIDFLHSLFISNIDSVENYVTPDNYMTPKNYLNPMWMYVVASSVVLKRLAATAQLATFVMALHFDERSCNGSLHE
ncbi:hypothetical protein AaE_000322, partial [Aphanomyces astaci]